MIGNIIFAPDCIEKSARAIENMSKALSENSKNEIKARDRVDISLEEYERLKDENRRLSTKVSHLECLLSDLGIPAEMVNSIIPGSTMVSCCSDYKDFLTHVRIEFKVDDISVRRAREKDVYLKDALNALK